MTVIATPNAKYSPIKIVNKPKYTLEQDISSFTKLYLILLLRQLISILKDSFKKEIYMKCK